jgi:heavy metal sensor kinase
LSSLAIFSLAYVLLSSALHQKDRELIESQGKLYASRYESDGLPALIEEIEGGHKESLYVRVVASDGRTVFRHLPQNPEDWGDFDVEQLETTPLPGDGQWSYFLGQEEAGELIKDPDRLELLTASLADGSWLQVGKTTEARKEVLEYFLNVSALVMVAVLVVGLLGGAVVAHRSLRPVRELAGVMRSITRTGKMDARVPTRQTGDELDELAGQFNELLGAIESSVERMRSALDTIAHELRTPMTRLRGTAEVALRSAPDLETCKQALADCLEESEQALTMLNALMDLAEAEAGSMKLELAPTDVPALVRSVVSFYEHVAEEKSVSIRTVLPERLEVVADARRLRQAVANLLDNAVKYTPSGGSVEIEARSDKQHAVISVRDTGMGIPPDELPRIWDRLYRGEAGRSQRGLGLGLGLVRAVVQAHKGSVEADSAPGGSTFVIRLPLNLSKM